MLASLGLSKAAQSFSRLPSLFHAGLVLSDFGRSELARGVKALAESNPKSGAPRKPRGKKKKN